MSKLQLMLRVIAEVFNVRKAIKRAKKAQPPAPKPVNPEESL